MMYWLASTTSYTLIGRVKKSTKIVTGLPKAANFDALKPLNDLKAIQARNTAVAAFTLIK
ncbi:hypothetical protein HMF3257_21760 [Spirosoma telluris]|uniref:Uncharacterized protein n=1 Tax=Spirosoma telluris TaxID=2183553 RepID=A0A327NQT5_9BACT|nr:hypothetical protein HMF3257_21760 [Spirosoma telluris]